MRIRTTSTTARSLVTLGAAVALALGGAALPASASAAQAAPAAASHTPHTTHANPHALAAITALATQRLALADKVAAAKYGTDAPIDDPARERQILDDVAQRSTALGIDPAFAQSVFRDQIEANKVVQRGLYARWDVHPEQRPTERPDLAKEVRPQLDRITTQLLDALREVAPTRTSPACEPLLTAAALRDAHARGFDALHLKGLARALPSVCAS
ncbi:MULTISPECIES: chorismate mutase [unclassified Streptomyces]|uniref:chorismate mutase n=1 Tax=unclassified Streptomyces TaxID=2593676 RepID=UPI00278BB9B3|nr:MULTISPECIES: chorismate mutase [unclassified Streptomyces]